MTLRRSAVGRVMPEQMPAHITPGSANVHVWVADVSAHVSQESTLWRELDHGERARAERFHFARDRTLYVVAHGLLRRLLGSYVSRAGSLLRFRVSRWGKPALVTQSDDGDALTFSLSHSGERIAIAVARGRAVGVDVERWTDDIVYDELAQTCFSPAEREILRALPAGDKQRAFFAAWSRKEAYIKAVGVGVSRGLDYFDVSLAPDESARLVEDRLAPGAAGAWTMYDLGLDDGYSGAVVAEGTAWQVECRTLAPSVEIAR